MYRDFDFTKVRFYTVKFEDEKQNQLDQFFSTYENGYSESIWDLKQWIGNIGERFGATNNWFRPEDNVSALPPPSNIVKKVDFKMKDSESQLRLYCIVLSEEVVILINGGIKESQLTQKSPTCWNQYMFASNIAKQIEQQKKIGNIHLQGKLIKRNRKFVLNYTKKD